MAMLRSWREAPPAALRGLPAAARGTVGVGGDSSIVRQRADADRSPSRGDPAQRQPGRCRPAARARTPSFIRSSCGRAAGDVVGIRIGAHQSPRRRRRRAGGMYSNGCIATRLPRPATARSPRRCSGMRRSGRCCRSCTRGSPHRSGAAFGQQADGRHDLARRAVAALERVVPDERLLHRMQRPSLARPSIVVISGRRSAPPASGRQHAPAVDQHRARAARALVAALLRPGQPEPSRSASSSVTRLSSRNRRALPLTRSVRSASVEAPRAVSGMDPIYLGPAPTDHSISGGIPDPRARRR